MIRPFLSLLIAVVCTVAGLGMAWTGSAHQALSMGNRFLPDPAGIALAVIGVLLLAVAALSLAIHWVGVLVVGAVHALLGLLALVIPFGNPFEGGVFSPVFQIAQMLSSIDRSMADTATVFFFSGTALAVGAFLVAAALSVRSRRLAPPSTPPAVAISSALGAVTLLASSALLLVAGGEFARLAFQVLAYDAPLAALTVLAGLLAGVAGLLLRWSSIGGVVAGVVVLAVGVYVFLDSANVPFDFPGRAVAAYGVVMVAGATVVAASIGGAIRPRPAVPAEPVAL